MMTLDFFKFLECVKLTHNPNPGYGFVSDGLDSYKGNDVESLILRGNEILGGDFFDKWERL